MKKSAFRFFMLLVLVLAGCSSKDQESNTPIPPTVLKIAGSGSVATILQAMEADFEKAIPGTNLEILSGTGTGGGVEGVAQGVLDVAAMARAPQEQELEANPDLTYFEIGKAGIALFTHPGVAIPSLTSEQAQGILSGDISQWDEVGGANTTILLYVRDEEEAATQELRKILIGDTAFPTSAVVLTSASDMITSVAGSSGSIGFGNWPAVLAKQANVSPLMLNEISPTDPTYPLLTIVGLGYDKDKQAEVQPLLDWLRSEEGQARLQTLGMILSTGE